MTDYDTEHVGVDHLMDQWKVFEQQCVGQKKKMETELKQKRKLL